MFILLHCDGYIITCVIMVVLLYRYVAIIDLCSKLKITLYKMRFSYNCSIFKS